MVADNHRRARLGLGRHLHSQACPINAGVCPAFYHDCSSFGHHPLMKAEACSGSPPPSLLRRHHGEGGSS